MAKGRKPNKAAPKEAKTAVEVYSEKVFLDAIKNTALANAPGDTINYELPPGMGRPMRSAIMKDPPPESNIARREREYTNEMLRKDAEVQKWITLQQEQMRRAAEERAREYEEAEIRRRPSFELSDIEKKAVALARRASELDMIRDIRDRAQQAEQMRRPIMFIGAKAAEIAFGPTTPAKPQPKKIEIEILPPPAPRKIVL